MGWAHGTVTPGMPWPLIPSTGTGTQTRSWSG